MWPRPVSEQVQASKPREDIPISSPEVARILYRAARYKDMDWPLAVEDRINDLLDRYPMTGWNASLFETSVREHLPTGQYEILQQLMIEGGPVSFLLRRSNKSVAVLCMREKYHRIGYRPSNPLDGFDVAHIEMLSRLGHKVLVVNATEWSSIQNKKAWLGARIDDAQRYRGR